jgi:hypothetical protein
MTKKKTLKEIGDTLMHIVKNMATKDDIAGIEQSPSSRMRGLVRGTLRLWFDDRA